MSRTECCRRLSVGDIPDVHQTTGMHRYVQIHAVILTCKSETLSLSKYLVHYHTGRRKAGCTGEGGTQIANKIPRLKAQYITLWYIVVFGKAVCTSIRAHRE